MTDTRALVTIDTEVGETARFTDNGFEKFVQGNVDGDSFGVPKIRKLLEQYGVPGEFFVDVYEADYYEEAKYRQMCERLVETGHEVQLHTHPGFQYDRDRRNMYEYSLAEQREILDDGIEYIQRWIDQTPVAHRAGMYGANNTTLTALSDTEISIDSSYFHGESNCRLSVETVNDPIWTHGIYEVPVTSDQRFVRVWGIPVPKRRPIKLDVNWLSSDEMDAYLSRFTGTVPYLVLFLHSSSFVTRTDDGCSVSGVDREAIDSFRTALEFVEQNDIEVVTFNDIETTLN